MRDLAAAVGCGRDFEGAIQMRIPSLLQTKSFFVSRAPITTYPLEQTVTDLNHTAVRKAVF